MKLGFVGLGRMGSNMVQLLLEKGHKVVGFNRSPQVVNRLKKHGVVASYSLSEMVSLLPARKVIWLMVPARAVDSILEGLVPLLKKGDIVIDGGNSFYVDSQRRYKLLKKKGIAYLDCGTSGGMQGAREGACMMVGGDKAIFTKVEKLFKDMCVPKGYGYMGKSGAGHFVKMVHNGIEYGMMGALNEGFEALEKHKRSFGFDMHKIAQVYAHGSIIESRLMSWLYDSFMQKSYLKQISCAVPKGETEEEMKALEKLANMQVLRAARLMRLRSRSGKECARYVAAMRNQFGGHKVNRKR